jgi:chorismate mutase
MVTLIVATTADPASINPAAALLAMPGWTAGPILPPVKFQSSSAGKVSTFLSSDFVLVEIFRT